MHTFRTTFELPEFPFRMDHHSKSIFIGSCFTESIGNYLKELRFNIILNPLGIIYNPLSICNNIHFLCNNRVFNENDLDYYNELWFSFYHHGRFSDSNKEKCLEKINHSIREASEFIRQADFLFLTFGTALVYTHNEKNEIVANCHKFPSETFSKSLLEPDNIVREYSSVIEQLRIINPDIKIIFTVSPIRHWKEGAVENQLSKSILFVAIHKIIKNNSNCFYFPSYELIMDDLRDYRFYAEDMIHINETAIAYVREKFSTSMISAGANKIMNEVNKLISAKNHRPFNQETGAHKDFKSAYLKQTIKLKKEYPILDLREFEAYFG